MKPITGEWVEMAEGCWFTAQQVYRARKRPVYDIACFQAQQCAEKYLKARLEEAGTSFRKVHHLAHLLALVTQVEPNWTILQPHLNTMIGAEDFLYPGKWATKLEAKQAIKDCGVVRSTVRAALGLPM